MPIYAPSSETKVLTNVVEHITALTGHGEEPLTTERPDLVEMAYGVLNAYLGRKGVATGGSQLGGLQGDRARAGGVKRVALAVVVALVLAGCGEEATYTSTVQLDTPTSTTASPAPASHHKRTGAHQRAHARQRTSNTSNSTEGGSDLSLHARSVELSRVRGSVACQQGDGRLCDGVDPGQLQRPGRAQGPRGKPPPCGRWG